MPRVKTTGRVYKSKSVSLEPELRAKAEARAASLGLSFSEYLRACLAVDIQKGGSIVIAPKAVTPAKGSKHSK